MASFSAQCPKPSAIALQKNPQQPRHQHSSVSFPSPSSKSSPPFLAASKADRPPFFRFQVAAISLNSAPVNETKLGVISSEGKDEPAEPAAAKTTIPDEPSMSEFMAQVVDLVKLVDSRDVVELQLKQLDCELIIRKKEALPQPPATTPVVMMQPAPNAMHPSQLPPAKATGPAYASPVPSAPAVSAPAKGSKSTSPPLKCPMAGTFYRSPAPGEPPFVKVGDKVQKGQVVCIIEAMKLMNEIEADQSGIIVEILAQDGKPVSMDTPLLVIEP